MSLDAKDDFMAHWGLGTSITVAVSKHLSNGSKLMRDTFSIDGLPLNRLLPKPIIGNPVGELLGDENKITDYHHLVLEIPVMATWEFVMN